MATGSMEKWFEQILLTIVIVTGYSLSSTVQVKLISNETLAFAPNLPGQEYVRTGEFVELNCSATGYTYLTWMKWYEEEGFIKFPWYPGSSRLRLRDDNKVLEVTRAIEDSDDGRYLCEAGNARGQVIRHQVVLTVVSCHVTGKKIYNTKSPPSTVIKSVGETVNLNCEGYFGCAQKGSEEERIAQWEYLKPGSHPQTVRNSSRYTITSWTSEESVIVGSYLTIKPLEEEDYKTTFVCLLQTAQVDSALTFRVHIQPPEVKYLYNLLFILLIIPILISVGIIYCLWGERIKYFYKFRCSKFEMDEATTSSEVLVLHSTADNTFVEEHVKPIIEGQGYTVFTRKDIFPGRLEVCEFSDKIVSSSTIFVVYSSTLLDDNEAVYLFKTTKETAHRGVVVIQKEKIPKERLKQFEDDEILKIAPSCMTSVKFPFRDPKNERKIKNFYYGLKYHLPPRPSLSVDPESSRVSVSSTTPLVQRNDEKDSHYCDTVLSYDLQNVSASTSHSDNIPNSKLHPHTQISDDSGRGDSPNDNELPFF